MSLRPLSLKRTILNCCMMGVRKTSRSTATGVRISMQLHCDYREYRPCATDPVEAQFQYHLPPLLTAPPPAGRGAGVEAFGFGAVPALAMGAFAATLGLAPLDLVGAAGVIRLGCGVLGLLIGFGAGFGCVLLQLPPMVTLRFILALLKWSLVSQ